MPGKIGEKRLLALLAQGIDLSTLPVPQQFEAFRTMARVMSQPLEGRPRRLPRHLRPRCSAHRRDGRRCQAKVVWDTEHDRPRNTKCRVHGGASTGPRTPEGKQRIAESNRLRAQARRQAQALAAAQAEALAMYQEALAKYEELRQWDMSGFSGLQDAMLQNQAYVAERAAQRCRNHGLDPRTGKEL
jgi:hypothetical protein